METTTNLPEDDGALLRPRRVSLALLLSLFGAGLGHLYAGRGRRGATLLALALGYVPAVYLLSLLPPSEAVLYTLVGLVLLEVGLALFALLDAARCAAGAASPYRARPYNNALLYVGLVVLCLMWGIMGAGFLRERAFEVYDIPTASMDPTLARGDRILVNKLHAADFERGDLVVFRAPDAPDRVFIKRVVGMPGEHVRVQDGGAVLVDDRPLAGEKVGRAASGAEIFSESAGSHAYRVTRGAGGREADARVPAGHVYLLGDNRVNSRDSRFFGPVPVEDVLGVAQYLYSRRDGQVRLGRVR